MKRAPCVVSVAEHAGWAHLLCVAAPGQVPAVIARRRVTLIDPGLPTMPYEHESAAMKEDDANALIARVRRSVNSCAALALERLAAETSPAHTLVALAIRKAPFPALPATVARVRQSYQLQCAADGMLYQQAISRAARKLGLDVVVCPRGEETSRAAEALGVTLQEVEEFVSRTGRPAGPPWTAEHRRAYAAGIAALAEYCRATRVRPAPRKSAATQ